MPQDDLVTVARYVVPWQADLARTLLESEGIEVFLADEHMARTDPYHSALVGGVRLMVRGSAADRAVELISAAEDGRLEPAREAQDRDAGQSRLTGGPAGTASAGSDGELRCPRCGSAHLERAGRLRALLGPGNRCRVCGFRFN